MPLLPVLGRDDPLRLLMVRLDDPGAAHLLAEAEALLDADDRRRLDARSRAAARRQFLAGRWLLRRTMAALLDSDPARLAIDYSPSGRPEVVGARRAGLSASLAHAGGWVVLALGPAARLGVDLEPLHRADAARRIAAAGLITPEERAALAALTDDDAKRAALRLWTAKEAVAKALGRDVWTALEQIVLLTTGPELHLARLPDGQSTAGWRIGTALAGGTHQLALAALEVRSPWPDRLLDVLAEKDVPLTPDMAGGAPVSSSGRPD